MPSWAALESLADGGNRLVVVERAERRYFDEPEIADWIRDARRIQSIEHPNIARVRDVVLRPQHVLVVADFVDGARWTDLAASASLETALRVAADALAGLGALHNLRDAARVPLKLVHGALTPDCLVVGLDGVTRIVGISRPRSATARLTGASSAHLAPEVLLEDESADARADVYSVGVLLWEALSRRPFLPNLQPSAIVTQLLSGRVPAVTVPADAPWAGPLGELVMRAIAADPDKRFASAAAMAADLRRVCAMRLPTSVRVAATIRASFGEAVRARREALERSEGRSSDVLLRASQPADEEFAIDITDASLEPEASQTASTVPPPGEAPTKVHLPVPEPPSLRLAGVEPALVSPLAPALPIERRPEPGPPALRPFPSPPPLLRPTESEAPMTTGAPLELPPLQPVFATAPGDPARPVRSRRVAVIASAVVLLAAATCWLSAKGSGARGAPAGAVSAVSAGTGGGVATGAARTAAGAPVAAPTAKVLAAPATEATVGPVSAPAVVGSAAPSPPPEAVGEPTIAAVPDPPADSPPRPTSAPAAVAPPVRAFPVRPTFAVPPAARPRPVRHGYDPQGI